MVPSEWSNDRRLGQGIGLLPNLHGVLVQVLTLKEGRVKEMRRKQEQTEWQKAIIARVNYLRYLSKLDNPRCQVELLIIRSPSLRTSEVPPKET